MFTSQCTITTLPAIAAAVALTAAPAFAQSQQSDTDRSRNASTVAAENLSDNPENYIGKTITVKEEVADVVGPNVFTIEDGEFFGTSPDILVFAPDAMVSPVEDQSVTVTGVVRRFTFAELEREYGWGWGAYPWYGGPYGYNRYYGTGYGPDYWLQYERRPVLIASSIRTEHGVQLVAQNDEQQNDASRTAANEQGDKALGTSGTRQAQTIDDLSKLTGSSATNYVGQQVRLKQVTIDHVAGKRGFWANASGGQRVFIGLDQDVDQQNLKQGQQVMVAGKVMKTPDDASKFDKEKFGLSSDDVNQLMQAKVFIRADALRSAGSQ
ncbi:MAG: hypothetical protein AB7O32_12615 [Vicinamibacterales bacterium]